MPFVMIVVKRPFVCSLLKIQSVIIAPNLDHIYIPYTSMLEIILFSRELKQSTFFVSPGTRRANLRTLCIRKQRSALMYIILRCGHEYNYKQNWKYYIPLSEGIDPQR